MPVSPDDGVAMVRADEMVKERMTAVAAAQVALPLWLAVIEQVPAETRVRVVPETVHCERVVEAKETARSEVAVADRATVPVPRVLGERDAKVIDCDFCWVELLVTETAVKEAASFPARS